jgi:hypothetical protein
MTNRIALPYIVAVLLTAAGFQAGAQTPAETQGDTSTGILKAERALPMTCVQAWIASRQSYPEMLAVVKTLAKVSLANRDLTFPNTREAGLDAGKGIAEDCKADPNALLFAVVDKHVRRVAEYAPQR